MVNEKPEKTYRQVSFKKELMDDIEQWIAKHPEAGYANMADLASEAVRIRLQELKAKYESKP